MPAGSDDVVILNAGLTVNESAFVVFPPPLSVNRTVKAAVPVAEGVPVIVPLDAARFNPWGSDPIDIDQVTGETAPDTVRVAEYSEPTVALANVSVVTTGLELTTICSGCVSVSPAPSSTLAVNGNVPFFDGIPVMVPLLFSEIPSGSAPADTDHA